MSDQYDFSSMYVEIAGYEGEYDEEGVIELEVPCACGGTATMTMSIEDMDNLVQSAKMFRDRRAARTNRRVS